MIDTLKDSAFINITYELSNIRIYKIQNNYWMYLVNETDIKPVESKYAVKIVNKVLKLTNGVHLSNLVFGYPCTYKQSDKNKIKELCKSQVLDKGILLNMLLLLK